LLLAVLGLALATWFASEAIEADLLAREAAEPASDPGSLGLEFTSIDVPGPLGDYPAWLVGDPAEAAVWAVVVHDGAETREATLELLPILAGRGWVTLVATYRGDAGAPPAPGNRHMLGADEWEDVEASVLFAAESGAAALVLVGRGTGGSAVLSLLRESDADVPIAAAVVDSPYLDPGAMVDDRMALGNVPGFLKGWAKALATFRFGVVWAPLDQVAAAEQLDVPILLIHGAADERVPVRFADALAAARPDLVEYARVDGAGHLAAFTAEPETSRSLLEAFLDRLFPAEPVEVGPVERPEPPE
jgi:alpha-beta hydrolase superfamily lysophospholipase